MKDQTGDILDQLGTLIDLSLQSAGCETMHFAFIVWCKCSDDPLYAVSSDTNNARVKHMLHDAVQKLALVNPCAEVEGHA